MEEDGWTELFNREEDLKGANKTFLYRDMKGVVHQEIGEPPLAWGEYPEGMDDGSQEAMNYDLFRSKYLGLPSEKIENDLGEEDLYSIHDQKIIKKSQAMPEGSQITDTNWIVASKIVHSYLNPNAKPFGATETREVYQGVQMDGFPAENTELEDAEAYANWGVNFMTAIDYNWGALLINAGKLNNAPPKVAKAMYYLMETADRDGMLLSNFGKGMLATALDPSTLVGLGTLGLGLAGKFAGKKLSRMAFKEVLKKTILTMPSASTAYLAGEGAVMMGSDNYARQNIKVDAEVQDDINVGEVATSTAIGGAFGSAIDILSPSVIEGGKRLIVAGGKKADEFLNKNKGGATLNMGVDPTVPIAEGLSKLGKALDDTAPKVDTSYRIQHTPNPEGARLDDMTGGGDYFPDDIYSINGLRIYGDANNKFDRESFDAIQSVKGKPDAEVTIYRAVPNEDNINTINSGDFVTLSREYAEMHGASGYGVDGQDAGKIIEAKVKVKHLRSDGNDLNEFGYFPENKGDVARAIIPTEEKNGIIAFHGSGADFDKFELSKIGTGEGNQAYGYGLYFTDTESIAKFYRNTVEYQNKIKGRNNLKYKDRFVEDLDSEAQSSDPYQRALLKVKGQLDYHTGNPQIAIQRSIRSLLDEISENKNNNIELSTGVSVSDYITKNNNETVAELKKLDPKLFSQETGKTYQVNIKAYKQELINYDTSLKEQTRRNQLILRPYYEKYEVAETADFGDLLEKVYRHLPQDEFAEQLSRQGIKGLFYKAGRTNTPDSKATNFVIFDDEIIDVMKKYGIVGAIGVSAMNDNDNVNSQEVTDGNT